MENLQLSTFLIPVIALILVVLLYIFLSGKAQDQTTFKRLTLILLALAFLLNLAWEVLQMPLYKGLEFNIQSFLFCALASVVDANMTLLLYYAFALIYKDPFYAENLTLSRTLILVAVGGLGAILAEMKYTSEGTWAYADRMPIVPIVKVGLFPVLQFMVLPALTYYLTFKILKKVNADNETRSINLK